MKTRTSLLASASLIIGLLVSAIAPSARAQNGFDLFGVPRTFIAFPPAVITGASTSVSVDLRGLEGVGKIDFFLVGDNAAGTATLTLTSSTANTNTFTAFSGIAYGVQTTEIITNNSYASVRATNTVFYPGTLTTATPATDGFAGTYIVPAAFTNASVALTNAGVASIGFNVGDAKRYLRLTITPGGTGTNYYVGAVLTARRQ